MNVKHILGLSFCTLLLIILFQQAGVWFAYHTQMQKTEAVLASSFKETFILVTDAQVNRLRLCGRNTDAHGVCSRQPASE